MDLFKETLIKMLEPFKNMFSGALKGLNKSKTVVIKIFVIVIPIVIVVLILHFVITGMRDRECLDVRNKIGSYVDSYLMSDNLYPTINGDSVTVDLDKVSEVKFKDKVCTGSVKVTNVNGEYIKTFYLNDCNYCSAGEFGSEKDSYKADKNVEVVVYFNYYNVTNNNSRWSDYIPFEEISTEETDGVKLPLDEKDLPNISKDAIITEIVKEDKVFYSYRDKRWLWYRNNVSYSDFSSVQPSGYTKKDTKTEIHTEFTEWSIDYPEVKEYRVIFNKTGYRWYKKDEDGNKIYWNNGEYYPEMPEEEYLKEEGSTITMYRYYDKKWKWYNGTARGYYSSQTSTAPSNSYKYKDNDFVSYSKWSNYKTSSSVTNENKGYREEVTNVHSRYMIKYKIRSFLVLDEYLERTEFENTMGKTIYDMTDDANIDLEVVFKYKY